MEDHVFPPGLTLPASLPHTPSTSPHSPLYHLYSASPSRLFLSNGSQGRNIIIIIVHHHLHHREPPPPVFTAIPKHNHHQPTIDAELEPVLSSTLWPSKPEKSAPTRPRQYSPPPPELESRKMAKKRDRNRRLKLDPAMHPRCSTKCMAGIWPSQVPRIEELIGEHGIVAGQHWSRPSGSRAKEPRIDAHKVLDEMLQ